MDLSPPNDPDSAQLASSQISFLSFINQINSQALKPEESQQSTLSLIAKEDVWPEIISGELVNETPVADLNLACSAEDSAVVPESSSVYFQTLKEFRVNVCDMTDSELGVVRHKYALNKTGSDGPDLTRRLNTEIRVLGRDLPCEASAAIFISAHTANFSLMKALISGCAETPYAHGLYLFDIMVPSSYPRSPPKLTLMTTGKDTVCFGPNLYRDGYVCLSIIGTWKGDSIESWNPAYSTLMGVLVSIQSLVMDNNIVAKEPGYDGYLEDGPDNRIFQAVVRYANIKYAMTEVLQAPPPEFKEVVLNHFKLKKDEIKRDVALWLEQASTQELILDDSSLGGSYNPEIVQLFITKGYAACLQEEADRLFAALESL